MADIKVGSWWEGVRQQSWWRVDEVVGGRVVAFCLRAPTYRWAEVGEVCTFDSEEFSRYCAPL